MMIEKIFSSFQCYTTECVVLTFQLNIQVNTVDVLLSMTDDLLATHRLSTPLLLHHSVMAIIVMRVNLEFNSPVLLYTIVYTFYFNLVQFNSIQFNFIAVLSIAFRCIALHSMSIVISNLLLYNILSLSFSLSSYSIVHTNKIYSFTYSLLTCVTNCIFLETARGKTCLSLSLASSSLSSSSSSFVLFHSFASSLLIKCLICTHIA